MLPRKAVLFLIIAALLYSRLVGLNWGLPYPMHPDERNMANAIEQLVCDTKDIKKCMNPHFFAYGQLPLYVGYIFIHSARLITLTSIFEPITFHQATLALRALSAFSSIVTVFVLYKIIVNVVYLDKKPTLFEEGLLILLLSFVPYAIQFAHFGTTESLLIMLYCLIIYLSLRLLEQKKIKQTIIKVGLLSGVAAAIKISSIIFISVPLLSLLLIIRWGHKNIIGLSIRRFFALAIFFCMTAFAGYIIASPHNVISFSEFLSSMKYESAVALGNIDVFYTRQFNFSLPYIFQTNLILPHAMGLAMLVASVIGYFYLPLLHPKLILLRVSLLVPFLIFGITFAKWSRFIAPVFPLFTVFASLFVLKFYKVLQEKNKTRARIITIFIVILLTLPGIAYTSIYTHEDVRFTASRWIWKNIPNNSLIVSETANVVDIPLVLSESSAKNYRLLSFDFYNSDTDIHLQQELVDLMKNADYVFVPSRRIFANHTCVNPNESEGIGFFKSVSYSPDFCKNVLKKYPTLVYYYDNLFNSTHYKKVAEFTSYPKLSLLGKNLIEFPDEMAEETWTVFDHPVIRIYKRL